MKLLIIQVSDIHLSTTKYPDNPVLRRASKILTAIESLFLEPANVGAVLLLVTGDIAYSGTKDEYTMAIPFFREIEEGLRKLFPDSQHKSIFLPGNHDCNFQKDRQARRKLIEEPDAESLADGSIVETATAIQNEFFEFCRVLSGAAKTAQGLARLYYQHQLEIDGKHIVVRTLNSAWASRIHESRTLFLPIKTLTPEFQQATAPDVAITALHHPYNWFEPINARALRRLLEESSDVILTGHEHSSDTYTKTGDTGEQNEYIEGGVLQESGDPLSSSFNVIMIDLDSSLQSICQFAWNSELYEVISEIKAQPFIRNKSRLQSEFELDPDFEGVLKDADAAFTHPFKERIELEDVFLYPDCVELDEKHSKTTARIVHGRDLITHVLKKGLVLITSSERAGKTALARSLFKDLRKNGKIPLMLNGRTLKPSSIKNIQKLLDGDFDKQYSPKLRTRYWQLPKGTRAVIVDDYHRLPATKHIRDMLIRELLQRCETVVLLGGNELRLQELMGHDRESRLLWEFHHCELMGFGHRLRAEFIKKWYRIGREGQVEDEAAVQKAISLEKTISSILGHDLLPPYPIYLLLLLQQLEIVNPHDTTTATYGRLYGAVVTGQLARSGLQEDLETKINYLTEFAFHLYKTRKDHLSNDEAVSWHGEYCKRHLDLLDYERLREDLVKGQVLQFQHGELRFRYKAGYYYFVASYLSDNLSKEAIRLEVKRLCTTLYREEAANIVVFLCHRSKDPLILDEVLATANGLFANYAESDVVIDTSFAGKLATTVAKPILEDRDPEKNRLRALEDHDKLRQTSESEDEVYAHRVEDESEDILEEQRDVVAINSAIKTIQISGQILRNFGGRLDGADKLRLTDACYSLGLRLMKSMYTVFEQNEESLLDCAQLSIQEHHKEVDSVSARQIANGLMFGFLKLATLGLIKLVSTSVGIEKLSPVFAEVLKANPTVTRRLIDLSIRLDHFAVFPVDQTLELHKEVRNSLLITDVLNQLVFNRFYYFFAPHDVKQMICKKLGIKIQPILFDRDAKING